MWNSNQLYIVEKCFYPKKKKIACIFFSKISIIINLNKIVIVHYPNQVKIATFLLIVHVINLKNYPFFILSMLLFL